MRERQQENLYKYLSINALLKTTWSKGCFKIKKKKKYTEANENTNTTYQNLWVAAKVVPRGKFMH